MERALCAVIGHADEQGLLARCVPTQGIELDAFASEIDLATNQAMQPLCRDLVCPAEELSTTGRIGAAEEDERACERRIRVGGEVPRKGTTRLLAASGVRRTMGGNIPGRMSLQVSLAAAMDALPESGLPEAVEALDGVLKPGFARWAKTGMARSARHRRLTRPMASGN